MLLHLLHLVLTAGDGGFMGNHLRELVETVNGVGYHLYDTLASKGCGQTVEDYLLINAPLAMCFDLGDDFGAQSTVMVPPPQLVRLPYDVCWFESQYTAQPRAGAIYGWLCTRAADCPDAIVLHEWRRLGVGWTCMNSYYWDPNAVDGRLVRVMAPLRSDEEVEDSRIFLGLCLAAIGVMNCSNIVTRRHDPDPKLQKARAKRGKQPLFSYHTLEIDPQASREAGIDQGGTHASPRVHLRRGHIRKFAPGKWCWVRETIVRGITPGMVHKDYALKGAVH